MKYNSRIIFFLAFLVVAKVFSQSNSNTSTPYRNTLFIEAGGNTFLYSINFDRLLKIKDNYRLSGRYGFMYFNSFSKDNVNLAGIPIEFSYLRGKKNNFLEFGVGVSTVFFYREDYYLGQLKSTQKTLTLMSTVRLGYRHQKSEGGLFYKIGFTPLSGYFFNLSPSDPNPDKKSFLFHPWIGAAIGWTLKS